MRAIGIGVIGFYRVNRIEVRSRTDKPVKGIVVYFSDGIVIAG